MGSKPIYSMTGYGRGEKVTQNRKISAEVKSVNNRFLDLQIRGFSLPVDIEGRLSNMIREKVGRGSLSLTLSVVDVGGLTAPPLINHELIKYYSSSFNEAAKLVGTDEKPSLAQLFTLPDVIKIQNKTASDSELEAEITGAVSDAVDALNTMRIREGDNLKTDLSRRIARIRELTLEAAKLAPERSETFKKRLEEKAAEVFKDNIDDSLRARLMMEVTIMADRVDVSEEITRLMSHCDQIDEILAAGGAAGKKLNFLQQEIGREANTLSSKAQDSALLKIALAIKEECESIKEQIQNIE